MEENEPKQRRPRTSNPAFSTPDQPAPPAKPAKAPPAVTFRPPTPDKTSSGTGTDAPEAPASTRPQRNPAKSTPRRAAPQPPAKPAAQAGPPPAPTPDDAEPEPKTPPPTRTRTQAATKSQQPRVQAKAAPPAASRPGAAAKAQPPTPPPAKSTPAKRTPRKAAPTKAAPAKAAPAKAAEPSASIAAEPSVSAVVQPAEPNAPAAVPVEPVVEKPAATVKALAAEIAPGLVAPDLATVPDEQPTAAPAVPRAAAPAADVRSDARTSTRTEGRAEARTEAWAALIADPGHGPELLAVAATQTIGPRAQEWVGRTRAAYPGATPDALARLAARQFTRFGSVSSLFAAVAGPYAPIALLGAAAFTHAELALHIAAAYGLDPTDRERAVELLVLTGVHPAREDAEAALAAAGQHTYEHTGLTDATWRLGRTLATQAGCWAAVRMVNHFFPGTSLLVAALTSRGAARAMAARATLHYREVSRAAVRAS